MSDTAQRKQSTTSIDDNPPLKSGRDKRKRPRPQYSDDNDEDSDNGLQDNRADTMIGGREEEVRVHLKQLIKVHLY